LVSVIGGFGIHLKTNIYANNIISSFFMFWTWGTLITAMCLGATSIPIERRSQALLSLPLSRWEIFTGKLIGSLLLVGCFQIVGFLISVALASHNDLPVGNYSYFALATAFAATFIVLCFTVPLGAWMSPMAVGTVWISLQVLLAIALIAFYSN